MQKTREERKHERSLAGSKAVTARWNQEHARKAAAGIVEIYNDVHAYGDYEITIKSIRSGKVNVLYLHEGSTRMNFRTELNGEPWKPEVASISSVTKFVRKSIVKTRSGRVL